MSFTFPDLTRCARAALTVLDRDGARDEGSVRAEAEVDGIAFTFTLAGPDAAVHLPADYADPIEVHETRKWSGTFILKVMAPVNVLELEWNADEPARIIVFSRGTWEYALEKLVGA